MPLLLADFIHIKVCKPNLRKTLDTTTYSELFLLLTLIVSIIALVINITKKK